VIAIYTYQDLVAVGTDETNRMDFVRTVIFSHQNSEEYKTAVIAQEYDRQQNTTIVNYQKLLYTISGQAVPDNYSANYKLCSNFFNRFVTQQNQHLLGNGASFNDKSQKKKLGSDFDTMLQTLGRYALVDGVSFGFWNYDHVEAFRITEFAPLYDEETGGLMASVRWWQIDPVKPLRATLYEPDGYTEYIWRDNKGEILKPKRAYVVNVRTSEADGMEILDGENYPSFPIVPMWANLAHQSEIVGIRSQIDCYDLIKSGFANDLDDASQIYWTIQNAGGMDDIDLAKFIERMRTVKAAVVEDDGAKAESHTVEVPYASREALLDRLRNDLYEDFMLLDVKNITAGAATATEIKASYEPMNNKVDMYEYCVLDFLKRLFFVAGIEADVTFTRSAIVNAQENIQVLIQAAQYLSQEYVTSKILEILGDADKTEEVLAQMAEEELNRFSDMDDDDENQQKEGVNDGNSVT